jgi:hypothetical protein
MACDWRLKRIVQKLASVVSAERRQLERERAEVEAARRVALERLESQLRTGEVRLAYDRVSTGKLRLEGWREEDRAGWHDGCALDALQQRRSSVLEERLRAVGATRETVALTHGDGGGPP